MKAFSPRTWRTLFVVFAVGYLAACAFELARDIGSGSVPRRHAVQPTERAASAPRYDRVSVAQLRAQQAAALAAAHEPQAERRAARRARTLFDQLMEQRIGEFLAALLTLGILSFLLGDNRFYRLTEAFMVGGVMAFMVLEKWDRVIRPDWIMPIVQGALPGGNPWNLFWLVLLVPGGLWYCVYSKKHGWMNQLVVALFIGCAVGPEFGKQVGILVPQVLDSIQPVWPFVSDPVTGQTAFSVARFEQLVFLTVMILSLLYFIFFFRPQTRLGHGLSRAGRLAMMIGFGAMFGNTVNTRLSWLAPRIGFLLDDWLGKLFGS